jgi:hypothetical protein
MSRHCALLRDRHVGPSDLLLFIQSWRDRRAYVAQILHVAVEKVKVVILIPERYEPWRFCELR